MDEAKLNGRYTILRDNDRTGFESNLGKAAEVSYGLDILKQPKYRPDLQPLDFSLWNEIDSRMAKEEEAWPATKHESKVEFKARLKRTALGLDADVINKAMASMKRRTKELDEKNGAWIRGD